MSKGNSKGSRKKGLGLATPEQPSEEQLIQLLAADLFMQLSLLCPAIPERIRQEAAVGVANNAKVLNEALGDYAKPASPRWGVQLSKPSLIAIDKKGLAIRVNAHKRFADCSNINEAFESLLVLAICTSPVAQAVLAAHGYKLLISQGGKPEAPKLLV